jgi:hypothetical protein
MDVKREVFPADYILDVSDTMLHAAYAFIHTCMPTRANIGMALSCGSEKCSLCTALPYGGVRRRILSIQP